MKRKLLKLTAAALALLVASGLGAILFFWLRPEGKFTPALSPAPTDPRLEVRVLSWNILQSQGKILGAPWAQRQLAFAAILQAPPYDIICLQEALPDQIAFFRTLLPRHALYAVGRDDGQSSGEHCPIFYDNHLHGKPLRCLDHLLTDHHWHVTTGGILRDKTNDIHPSDHFGLWAHLALR